MDRAIDQTEFEDLSDSRLELGLIRKATQVLENGPTPKKKKNKKDNETECCDLEPVIKKPKASRPTADAFKIESADAPLDFSQIQTQQSVEFLSESESESETMTVEEVKEKEEIIDVAKEELFEREDSEKDLNKFLAKHFTQEDIRVQLVEILGSLIAREDISSLDHIRSNAKTLGGMLGAQE